MIMTINGEKCYPCCSWEHNQHKIYNMLDKLSIEMFDTDMDADYDKYEALSERYEKVSTLLSMFDNHVYGDTVYLPWKWYTYCKEVLRAY